MPAAARGAARSATRYRDLEHGTPLRRRDRRSHRVDRVDVDRDRRDARPKAVLGELGAIRGRLSTQRRRDARVATRVDDPTDGVEHGRIGVVE